MSGEQQQAQEPNIFKTILQLLITKQIFIKCPSCGKSLGIFETFNEHCSFCGDINHNDMIIIQGLRSDKE